MWTSLVHVGSFSTRRGARCVAPLFPLTSRGLFARVSLLSGALAFDVGPAGLSLLPADLALSDRSALLLDL